VNLHFEVIPFFHYSSLSSSFITISLISEHCLSKNNYNCTPRKLKTKTKQSKNQHKKLGDQEDFAKRNAKNNNQRDTANRVFWVLCMNTAEHGC